jgi:hypothetical protein
MIAPGSILVGVALMRLIQLKRVWAWIFVGIFLLQCAYEYVCYYKYEAAGVPMREVWAELEKREKNTAAIYLPQLFPLVYAGIDQLEFMAARDGVRNSNKAAIYHIDSNSRPYKDIISYNYPRRLRMQQLIQSIPSVLKDKGVAGVRSAGLAFVESVGKEQQERAGITLKQFFEDPNIPENSYFLSRIQEPAMYPMLFSFFQFNDKDIEYAENVSRVFYSSTKSAPCMVLYRKKKQP